MTEVRAAHNGEVSFWIRDSGGRPERRPPLTESTSTDVVIVGGGFTGLWAAFYLKQQAPELDVTILEREFCGYGASGRNGGYVTPRLYWPKGRAENAARARMHELAVESVEEIWRILEREGIDAGQRRSGALMVATNPAQAAGLARMRLGGDEVRLSADELAARVRVAGARSGIFESTTFRVHPGSFVRGLLNTVEALGVRFYEGTAVREIQPHRVVTDDGLTVRSKHILRATEGYTASLKGLKRRLLPLNSAMIVTAPLEPEVRERIGWFGGEMLDEAAHAVAYSQITDDGRIALGGRGVPYRYGSGTDTNGVTAEKTARDLRDVLTRLFPDTARTPIDHLWCGVLGVPRDWRPSVGYQASTGVGWAGGYTGNGVAAANLAGRTFADLVLGNDSELVSSPWVNRVSRNWEFEPLRWIGGNFVYGSYGFADRLEARSGSSKASPLASFASFISQKP